MATTPVRAESASDREWLLQQQVYDAQSEAARARSEADAAAANKGPSADEIATAIVTKQREDRMAEEYAKAVVENEAAKAYLKQAEQKDREAQQRTEARIEAAASRERSNYAKAHPSYLFEAQLGEQEAAEKKVRSASANTEISQEQVEAEAKRHAQEAREMKASWLAQRFAPDGTVYNLKPITVAVGKKKVVIPPETELKLTRKNANGTVHVQKDNLEADVLSEDVTNERDWMHAYRTLHAGEDR